MRGSSATKQRDGRDRPGCGDPGNAAQRIRRKHVLPAVATLGDVMRNADGYHSTFARHTEIMHVRDRLSQFLGTVSSVPLPIFNTLFRYKWYVAIGGILLIIKYEICAICEEDVLEAEKAEGSGPRMGPPPPWLFCASPHDEWPRPGE